jgi:hypothetical protein
MTDRTACRSVCITAGGRQVDIKAAKSPFSSGYYTHRAPKWPNIPHRIRLHRQSIQPLRSVSMFFLHRLLNLLTVHLTCSGAPSGSNYPPQNGKQRLKSARKSFDGSNALFALYNRKVADFDREFVGNWTEHIRDLIVLVRYGSFFEHLNVYWTFIEWSSLGRHCGIPCTGFYCNLIEGSR